MTSSETAAGQVSPYESLPLWKSRESSGRECCTCHVLTNSSMMWSSACKRLVSSSHAVNLCNRHIVESVMAASKYIAVMWWVERVLGKHWKPLPPTCERFDDMKVDMMVVGMDTRVLVVCEHDSKLTRQISLLS